MNKSYKMPLLSLGLLASLGLVGCLGESTKSQASSEVSQEMEAAGRALFEIPSALQSANPSVVLSEAQGEGALAKTAVVLDSSASEALEPYRWVPAYLHVAESAKQSLQQLISDMASEDWPEEWEGTDENGYFIQVASKDSTLDGESDLRFRSLSMKKDGQRVLWVSYFKNARNQFSGTFWWRSEGDDSLQVSVHFNERLAGDLGERMVVRVQRGLQALEDANAPSVVRVVAVRKGTRVAVSALSYHPTWEEPDSSDFWVDGPRFVGVRAVADSEKDVALIKVAMADTLVRPGTLFKDYLLHDVMMRQATENMKRLMLRNDTLNQLVWWALDKGKSLHAAEANPLDGLDFLAYTGAREPQDLTVEQAYQVLQNSREHILAGNDQELKKLYWLVTIQQPIMLRSQARLVGAGDVAEGFGLVPADLESDDVELPEPSEVFVSEEPEF